MKTQSGELYLNISLGVKTIMQENTCSIDKDVVEANVANYALLTMGSHMTHWEGYISNGTIDIECTFKELAQGENYDDELGLSSMGSQTHEMTRNHLLFKSKGLNENKLSDHCILWIYRVVEQDQFKAHRQVGVEQNNMNYDKVRRVYLIGAVALDLELLIAVSIGLYSQETGESSNNTFEVHHNLAETFSL